MLPRSILDPLVSYPRLSYAKISIPSSVHLSPSLPRPTFPRRYVKPLFRLPRTLGLQILVRAKRQPAAQQHERVEHDAHAGAVGGAVGLGDGSLGRGGVGFGVTGLVE